MTEIIKDRLSIRDEKGRELMTVAEAAELMGKSERQVYLMPFEKVYGEDGELYLYRPEVAERLGWED